MKEPVGGGQLLLIYKSQSHDCWPPLDGMKLIT